MKFAILFLATIVTAAPPADEDELVINEKFFPDKFVIYTGKHDIVDILFPLNNINFNKNMGEDVDEAQVTLFFVEADVKDNGEKDYKGLYVYKNHQAKKVLENGQSATYTKGNKVYFGAKDGIYKYDDKDMTATKYGTVNDSVIKMAVDAENERVYYLTEDYVLYKYDDNEMESAKVDAVKDARDIAFDYDGNLFYYDGNKQFYTYNSERVLKIEGLPAHPTSANLIKSFVEVNEVYAVIDDRLYEIKADGTSETASIKFQSKPTAYAPDAILLQYYAYKQKIYMYNLSELINDKNIEELSACFEDKEEELNTIKNMKVFSRL